MLACPLKFNRKTPDRRGGCSPAKDRLFLLGFFLFEDGLSRSQASDRNPERRATHVIESDAVAEFHTLRVAAVLAANADLEVVARRSTRSTPIRIRPPTPSISIDWNGSAGTMSSSRYAVMNGA